MIKLALLGGPPAVLEPLPPYPSMGPAEADAVARVMQSGTLSGFYGSWGEQFLGGPVVQEFETAWSARFASKHSVSVNSATSGLIAALGAIGLSPGDEVIVPPYTMSATAMAPLFYGAIPVFADIEEDCFCLDPAAVEALLNERTRAVIAVNLFGQPAALRELRALCDRYSLKLIEDNAQSPTATLAGRYTGTWGHIGVYSLNYHKHIHTGEGGICVTDDPDLALRMQLIRNHGENAVEALGIESITNLIGFNFRLTEIQAAIGLEQLRNIEQHVSRRQKLAEALSSVLADQEVLIPPAIRPEASHVYYVWACRYKERSVSRERFSAALQAEGFPHFTGYIRPLYMLPVFQRRIALGKDGFPFNLAQTRYEAGLCPVTERLYERELLAFEPCAYSVSDNALEQLCEALRKVCHNFRELG